MADRELSDEFLLYRDFDGKPITRIELRERAKELTRRGDHAGAFRLLWKMNGVHAHELLED